MTDVFDRLEGARSNLGAKAPVRVATVAAIVLGGLQSIDNVTLAEGDRVLVKNQVAPEQNGIYVVANGAWTRAKDFDGNTDIARGTTIMVSDGAQHIGKLFRTVFTAPLAIGIDALTFEVAYIETPPNASTITRGIIRLATTAETLAGTEAAMAVAPSTLRATVRERLTANRTYYVRTDGNDGNTGLTNSAGGAFLTLTRAAAVVSGLDLNNFGVIIKLGNSGTFTAQLAFNVYQYPIGGMVTIEGDTVTPGNTIVSVAGQDAIHVSASMGLTVRAVELRTTTNGNGILARGGGAHVIIDNGVRFGACAGSHMAVSAGGLIVALGVAYSIVGSAAAHCKADRGGFIEGFGNTVTLTGTPAFSEGFASAYDLGCVSYGSGSFSGATTGKRYTATNNSVIETFGGGVNYFPGSLAGTLNTGAVYS